MLAMTMDEHRAPSRGFGVQLSVGSIHYYATGVNIGHRPRGRTDPTLREQQAEQTRARVVAAAAELIRRRRLRAHHASRKSRPRPVSPTETVQGQGPKAALLIAAARVRRGRRGGGRMSSTWMSAARLLGRSATARRQADRLSRPRCAADSATTRTAHAGAGAAPAAASSDPELDRYLAIGDASPGVNRTGAPSPRAVYRDRGWLRDDVPFDETRRDRGGGRAAWRPTCGWPTAAGRRVAAYRAWLPAHAGRDGLPSRRRRIDS